MIFTKRASFVSNWSSVCQCFFQRGPSTGICAWWPPASLWKWEWICTTVLHSSSVIHKCFRSIHIVIYLWVSACFWQITLISHPLLSCDPSKPAPSQRSLVVYGAYYEEFEPNGERKFGQIKTNSDTFEKNNWENLFVRKCSHLSEIAHICPNSLTFVRNRSHSSEIAHIYPNFLILFLRICSYFFESTQIPADLSESIPQNRPWIRNCNPSHCSIEPPPIA